MKSGIVAFSLTRAAANKLLSPLGKGIDDLQNEINSSGETHSSRVQGVTVTVKADVTPTLDATKQLYIQGLTPDNNNALGANAQLIVRINLPLPDHSTAGV